MMLTEDGAWNLVDILEVHANPNGEVNIKVRHLRQVRPHPHCPDIRPGTEMSIMFVRGITHYCGWSALSLAEIRQEKGFQEEWITPELPSST